MSRKILSSIPSEPLSAYHSKWRTPDDFYRERDNRTVIAVGDLHKYALHPVEIYIDPDETGWQSVQQIALTVCNLTARWCRHVKIFANGSIPLADRLRNHGHEFLEQRILDEMYLADPFGDFRVVPINADSERLVSESPLRLFIGKWQTSTISNRVLDDDFVISASGWCAIGRRGRKWRLPITRPEAVVPAAALAAAMGAADLFKRAVRHHRKNWMPDFCWNLYTQNISRIVDDRQLIRFETTLDLDKILLAGIGAIGSSLVYLLDMMHIKGALTLLDRDRIETSNLNRSPLFNIRHALEGDLKTSAAAKYLESHVDLTLRLIDGTWHEKAPELIQKEYDVWISFTNEDGAWAEIPFQMPPIILQGTTTSGWGFGAGRHIPRIEDCTLCRLPKPESVFRGPCANGEIESSHDGIPTRASLPFLSAASASLVLAELMKLSSPGVIESPNEISADLRIGLPIVTRLKRLADTACRGCRASRSKIWEERGGRGRFRHLSSPKF